MRMRIVIDSFDGKIEATTLRLRAAVKILSMDRVAFWNLPKILLTKWYQDQAIDYNEVAANTGEIVVAPEKEIVARFGRYMQPHINPILKDGRVVITHPTNEGTVYVVEFEPGVRTITERLESDTARDHALSMPYVFLVIHVRDDGSLLERMSVFCGYNSMEALETKLYMLNLPNIFPDRQEVCLIKKEREKKVDGPDPSRGLAYIIDFWVHSFWNNTFNNSVEDCHFLTYKKQRGHPGSFDEWERMSMRDNRYGLGLKYFGLDKSAKMARYEDCVLTIGDVLKVRYILEDDSLVDVLTQFMSPTTTKEKK